jgi:hypothetical protein
VSLIGLVAFTLAVYLMGASHNLLWMIVVLPLGVWAGIIAAKADKR